jgi:hypothetical protein
MRIVAQLGGKVRIGNSGQLALSGIDSRHPCYHKLVEVLKLPKHKNAIMRELTWPELSVDDIAEYLEQELESEAMMDLFGPCDPTFQIESELAKAASQIQMENDSVDAMRVDFSELIQSKHASSVAAGESGESRESCPCDSSESGVGQDVLAGQTGEVPVGLGSSAKAGKRKPRRNGVPQSDRPTHSGSNAPAQPAGAGLVG